MAKRHHAKTKDKAAQAKLELIAMSTERREMPRPTVFKDKSKYDRNKAKQSFRKECFA